MEREWFAIKTKPNREILAQSNFERQGLVVYLPKVMKTVRHARRVKKVARPFFPGYLFLHLAEMERNWPAISNTIGSLSPVKFGERYPVVPDEIIEELKNREDEQGFISMIEMEKMRKGQKIKVLSGELEGLYGLFQCARGADRAIVFLDMLKRSVAATVPVDSLQAV